MARLRPTLGLMAGLPRTEYCRRLCVKRHRNRFSNFCELSQLVCYIGAGGPDWGGAPEIGFVRIE